MTDHNPGIVTTTVAIAAPVVQVTGLHLKIVVKVVPTDAQPLHIDNQKIVCDHELSGEARDPKCEQEAQVHFVESKGHEDNDVLTLCHIEKGKKNPIHIRLNRGSVQAQVSKFKIPIYIDPGAMPHVLAIPFPKQ